MLYTGSCLLVGKSSTPLYVRPIDYDALRTRNSRSARKLARTLNYENLNSTKRSRGTSRRASMIHESIPADIVALEGKHAVK
jgi:hypothetical protein